MTDVEKELLQVLEELDAAARAMPKANPKPNLLPIFDRIEQLKDSLSADTDPGLIHYLERKSYEKARLFLLERDGENVAGNCGHAS